MSQTITDPQIDRAWWKEAVVYQIYPRSFNDSNADGIGDLRGIIERVDYLDDLGVDAVWLCPVYESPMHDNGYDISDYRSIHPQFGTIEDWEQLLDALHARDIRLLMDLVVNHTSIEHDWFQRSRRREDGYESFYHWHGGEPDQPPNNWGSLFGGSAWSYDDEREQWYLSIFDSTQPDLNWRNPDVRREMESVAQFWLDKGVDGFRLDAISHLSKADGYPDGDPDEGITGIEQFTHGPRLDEYLRTLCTDAMAGYDAVTVGEMGASSLDETLPYLGEDGVGIDMLFQFDHANIGDVEDGRLDAEGWGEWDLDDLRTIMTRRQERLDGTGWDPLFLGNHDLPRAVSQFGDDTYRHASATLLATFLLTMRGTPFIYQGEEIGMTNVEFDALDDVDDVWTVGTVEHHIEQGWIDSFEDVRDVVNYRSRDHSRTPMQWSDDDAAGFTDGEPWLAVGTDHGHVNAETARRNENSVWHYYRRLIDLRHDELALVYGDYDLWEADDDRIYPYTRAAGEDTLLVVLNWSAERATFDGTDRADPTVLVSNYDDPPAGTDQCELRPYEAIVYCL